MAQVSSIDSNIVGLRYALESSPKTLPGSPTWYTLEPNSFGEFGAEIATTPRNPINPSRQRKKGVTTGLTASASFNTDLTQENLQDLFQGFLYADFRNKDELSVATVDGTNNDYEPASGGDGYVAGDLLFAKDFDDAANNGLKVVTGTPGAATVPVTDTGLVTASTQTGTISKVGHAFGSGEVDIDASGTLPVMDRVSGSFDFTTLGLVPGEFIYIGGDVTGSSGDQFTTAANNGFKRIRSVTATQITFDKSDEDMVTEAAGTLVIRIFIGRALKNESSQTNIVRKTYTLERTLGAPDDSSTDLQSENVQGCLPNELTINLQPESLVTCDLSFVGEDVSLVDGGETLLSASGSIVAVTEADGFNTTSDFGRFRLAAHSDSDEAPTPLFTYNEEMTLTVNNNVNRNAALDVLGSAVNSLGQFEISASLTSYFGNNEGADAVRNNTSMTIDFTLAKNNAGIAIDLPLITLGGGQPSVEQDQPIKLPLTADAATGAGVVSTMDHTMLLNFFDYLPTAAAP